jgi:hypothetical protein
MKNALARIVPTCLVGICLLWYWPQSHAARAGGESPGCRLVVEALESASKLKVGMLRADLERDFDQDGGISARDRGVFTYRHCRYIKIEVEFGLHEDDANAQSFSPADRVSKISRPYLAYPVSD